ncbi:hypothetical protein [Rheinheimera pacifica]|uniref:hypothetical protein n=1 Tax=Rheinheimera pacifica TaxID=173990 RepID=UPI002EDA214A
MSVNVRALQVFMIAFALVGSSLLTYNDSPTEPKYALITLSFIVVLLAPMLNNDIPRIATFKKNIWGQLFFFMPVAMLLVWFYGLLVAVLNGNEILFALRNFTGMLFYFFLYSLLIAQPSIKNIFNIIFLALLVQLAYAVYYSYPFFSGDVVFNLAISISENKTAYSVGFSIFFPFVTLLLYYYVSNDSIRKNLDFVSIKFHYFFIFIAVVLFSIIPNLSKGFFIALVFSLFFPVLYTFYSSLARHKSVVGGLGFFMQFSLIFLAIFVMIVFWEPLIFTFSNSETSNAERATQFGFIVEDLVFWGKGLGALVDGYDRNHYGLELTYLSIVHKFGILGILIVCYFFITFFCIFINLLKGRQVFVSFFAFGLMLYTVPAAGNPLLFDPLMIMLHCFAVYMLLKPDGKFSKVF